MTIVEDLIAISAVLSIAFFLAYIVGLSRLPNAGRPETPTVDRFGDPLPESENPGFEETEEQSHSP